MRYPFLLITLLVAGIGNLWGFTPHPPCEKDTLLLSQGPYFSGDTVCHHPKVRALKKSPFFMTKTENAYDL